MSRALPVLAVLLFTSSATSPAAAQLRTTREAYDGRPPPDHTAEDAALAVPRALLAPFWGAIRAGHLISEAMLAPLGPPPSSMDAAEPAPPPFEVLPVLQLETERTPAIGAYATLRAAPWLLRGTFQHWDDRRLEGALSIRLDVAPRLSVLGRGFGASRADRIFHGLGWDAPADARSRYRHHRGGGALALESRPWRASRLRTELALARHGFEAVAWGGEPSLTAQRASPEGFVRGVTLLEARFVARLDDRGPDAAARPGGAIELGLTQGADLDGGARWLRVDATSEATARLAPEHDLTLGGWVTALAPTGGETPFVALPALGGQPGRLAGLLAGRLRGETAAVLHLRYRWGISEWADAALHAELGNVFGPAFEGFGLDRQRLSVSMSIDTLADDAHRVGLIVGFGTDPLVRGATVREGRVAFFIGSPPS